MSYIGNPIVSTDFPVDYASGTGSTTAFTLSIAPASVNAVDVEVSGVSQSPQTYTLSGTTLTFSAAPPSGTNNIVFKHRGVAGIPNTPSAGSVVTTSIADANVTPAKLSTGAPDWDTSSNLKFNSGYGSNATAYGCRAWVNFNGTGTPAIRASGNVSSITDLGAGSFQVNFTNTLSDANYSVVALRSLVSTSSGFTTEISSTSTSSFLLTSRETSSVDPSIFCASVFR